MEAIIMVAGKGSRLYPLTKDIPKSFLEIGGKKIIEHHISMLREVGVKKIILVTGNMEEKFVEKFKGEQDIKLVYNPFYEYTNVLGSFWFGKNELQDDFIYIHGDTLFEKKILEKLIENKNDAVLAVDKRRCDEEEMKVIIDSSDKIIKITKTMNSKEAHGEFIGLGKFSKNILSDIKSICEKLIREKQFNEYFEAILSEVIQKKIFSINYIETEDYLWNEIDFIEDYNDLKDKWNKKNKN